MSAPVRGAVTMQCAKSIRWRLTEDCRGGGSMTWPDLSADETIRELGWIGDHEDDPARRRGLAAAAAALADGMPRIAVLVGSHMNVTLETTCLMSLPCWRQPVATASALDRTVS